MRNIFDKSVWKIKTQILCSKNSFRESFRLWNNVEKHGTAGQATDDGRYTAAQKHCDLHAG
jgi:hypothetical protein